MLAYSVLNFEQDGRKGAKFLSDAVDEYKTAIDLVDATCSSSRERVPATLEHGIDRRTRRIPQDRFERSPPGKSDRGSGTARSFYSRRSRLCPRSSYGNPGREIGSSHAFQFSADVLATAATFADRMAYSVHGTFSWSFTESLPSEFRRQSTLAVNSPRPAAPCWDWPVW